MILLPQAQSARISGVHHCPYQCDFYFKEQRLILLSMCFCHHGSQTVVRSVPFLPSISPVHNLFRKDCVSRVCKLV